MTKTECEKEFNNFKQIVKFCGIIPTFSLSPMLTSVRYTKLSFRDSVYMLSAKTVCIYIVSS